MDLAKLLGVPLNYIWNHRMRGTGPEPEPEGVVIRSSNRRHYLPCLVLEWLSTREGSPIPAWQWCRRWLAEHHMVPPDEVQTQIALAVPSMESRPYMQRQRRYRVRQEAWLARLREVLAR
jgi:hypothetical protein